MTISGKLLDKLMGSFEFVTGSSAGESCFDDFVACNEFKYVKRHARSPTKKDLLK